VEKNYLNLFAPNTDASSSIRGIYYQFLLTLEKWITNFLEDNNSIIEIEVEDDIKEVSGEIIFTQVKSYSSTFSLRTIEVKKSLLNFYFLFLKYNSKTPVKFCFYTNTEISKSEKLLNRWINEGVDDDSFRAIVRKKIKEILTEAVKKKKSKLSQRPQSPESRNKIKIAEQEFKADLTDSIADQFIGCINWEFYSTNPHSDIDRIEKSIKKLLEDKKFKNINSFLLKRILLCEIFRYSKFPKKEQRTLSKYKIEELIEKSEKGLIELLNRQFLEKIKSYEELEHRVSEIQENQINIQKELNKIGNTSQSISSNKELTLLPISKDKIIYGRDKELKEFFDVLSKGSRVNLHGFHGSGKSFFVQKFIESYYDNFDRIAWIDYSIPTENMILDNGILLENLGLSNLHSVTKCFQEICYKLNSIKGNNVLVLDNYESENSILPKLLSVRNWKIIIVSKEKVPEINKFKLDKIHYHDLKSYFLQELDLDKFDDDNTLLRFFKKVDYSPLVIKICIKTIKNSLDINIYDLLKKIEEQELDNPELEVNILGEDYEEYKSIVSYFLKKYQLDNLSDDASYILSFLSILPSKNIEIEDLAMIGGKKFFSKNKAYYVNIINELDRKGWIEREGNKVSTPNFLQEIIRYEEHSQINPFIGHSMYNIPWLSNRIPEFLQTSPKRALRFIRLGESILNSIPEKYRIRIFQPLIILENEILHAYGILFNFTDYNERWRALSINAKEYLYPKDINLGTIYNNLALSYDENDDLDKKIEFLKKSITICKANIDISKFDVYHLLITAYTNLSYIFFLKGDFKQGKNKLNRIFSVYKSGQRKEDYLYINALGLHALYHRKSKDHRKAIEIYNNALNTFNSLKGNDILANKTLLLTTLLNLSYCKLLINEEISTELELIEQQIREQRLTEFESGLKLLETSALIYEKAGNYEKAIELYEVVHKRRIALKQTEINEY